MEKELFDDVLLSLDQVYDSLKNSKGNLNARKLTVSAPKQYNAEEIKTVRSNLKLTQKELSYVLGVSLRTVESWESGINIPKGSSARLLKLLSDKPELLVEFYELKEI